MKIKDLDNDYSISESNKILIPNSIKSPFKIIFEIRYSLQKEEKETDLEIIFKSLSIGDPCYGYSNKLNVCQNSGKCQALGPNNYICNCIDTNYGGRNCEYHNICNDEVS